MHWLDLKWNRQIDHILFTLVKEIDPHYKSRHEHQEVGVKGLDLTEWQQQEILISARAISYNLIEQFDDTQFHIASVSHPRNYHAIDLDHTTCECQDFLHIHFASTLQPCMHIFPIFVQIYKLKIKFQKAFMFQEIPRTFPHNST